MQKVVPSFAFRARARSAMKPVMSILLVVALIAALPSLISSTVLLMTSATPETILVDFSDRAMQVMEKYGLTQTVVVEPDPIDLAAMEADVWGVYDAFFADMDTFARTKGPIILGLSLMTMVLSPALTLGLINALLHALRRQEFTFSIALSRLRYFPKALGMELLLGLKYLLWMLPGMALMIAAMWLPAEAMILVMLLSVVVMMIPVVIAAYRYALAIFILADRPDTRITECIRRSKEIMKRRKLELFFLELSFIGWNLLVSYFQVMADGLLGPVLGMALGQFATLFLTVYMTCTQAAFYQEYAVTPVEAPETPDAPETPTDAELEN